MSDMVQKYDAIVIAAGSGASAALGEFEYLVSPV